MNQRNHRADTKVQTQSRAEGGTKAYPDVDPHHNRRRDHRHGCAKTEIFADLRSYVLNPAHFEFAGADLLGKAFFDLVSQSPDFHGGLLKTNQIFVGVRFAEVLNHSTAQIHFVEALANFRYPNSL